MVLDGPKHSAGFGWRSASCDKSFILQELLEYWSYVRSECYYLTRRGVQTSREVPPQTTSADPAEGSRTFDYGYLCNLCSVRLAHHAPIEILIHTK